MHSLQGQLLVAVPHQLDPNFVQTVILIVQHSDRGTVGLILNCPWEQSKAKRRRYSKENLHFGGPVAGPLMAVHGDPMLGEIEILPGLFFSGAERNVFAIMRQKRRPCRIFVGYAGWGPKQLEYEIDQGAWRTLEATTEWVFSRSEDLWSKLHREALETMCRALFHLRHVPSDPMFN